jgi:aryl-alcohol dehydrogenase-like predicted oxidoreductase
MHSRKATETAVILMSRRPRVLDLLDRVALSIGDKSMEYRSLGRTGVKVSPLCLGCWMFGDRASKEESVSILDTAFDAGINFLDTSNVYGGEIGRSESIIGEVVKAKGNRDNLIIATKVYFPVDLEDPNGRGISRRSIIAECEKSLRRLGSDYIDLYYMHRLDPEVPVDEPLRALDDLIRQGKVRYIGTSTTAAWQFVESLWVSKELGLNRFIAETPPYNMLDRRIEKELIPMAQTFGVAVNPWAPIASGILSGLYRRGMAAPEGSRLAAPRLSTLTEKRVTPGAYDMVDAIEPLAKENNCSLGAFALAWTMNQPGITSPITGPEKLSDIQDSLTAVDVTITDEDRAIIDAVNPPTLMESPFYESVAARGEDQFRMHPHRV